MRTLSIWTISTAFLLLAHLALAQSSRGRLIDDPPGGEGIWWLFGILGVFGLFCLFNPDNWRTESKDVKTDDSAATVEKD